MVDPYSVFVREHMCNYEATLLISCILWVTLKMDDQDIKNRIIEKMLRKRVTGGKKQQVDTVVNYSLPSHAQGRGRDLIGDMLADPDAPIEGYGGGHRQNIRLTSPEDAVKYLRDNDGNVPFPFD